MACAGATKPADRPSSVPLDAAADTPDVLEAQTDSHDSGDSTQNPTTAQDTRDGSVAVRRLCLAVDRPCPSVFSTTFRLTGGLEALRASSLTVCRNRQCYSNKLAPLLDAIRAPHFGNARTLWFPDGGVAEWLPWNRGGLARATLTITTDSVNEGGCDPSCEALVTFDPATGQVPTEGDVYDVRIGRTGDRSTPGAIHDTVRYETIEMANCQRCTFSSTDHRDDAPIAVR
jgi:hypothetical protein